MEQILESTNTEPNSFEKAELADTAIKGARVQVEGPRPFPSKAQARTSTEIYAAGGPPDTAVGWVIEAARKQLEKIYG